MGKLNHLLIIPDGSRRYARREYLTDMFKESKEKFRYILKGFAQISELETRIEEYDHTGNDPLYQHGSKDLLDSNQINVPQGYLLEAYRKGAKIFDDIIKWILQGDEIFILSIYGIQVKNLGRSDEQVAAFMKAETEAFNGWAEDKYLTSRCEFKFVGDKEAFEPHMDGILGSVIKEFNNSTTRLEKNSLGEDLKINILAPYDFSWEINQAIVDGVFDLKRLVVPEKVDLIIRSGNSKAPLSGALPCQAAHSQFVSIKEYFQDFNTNTIQNILKEYNIKKRGSGL